MIRKGYKKPLTEEDLYDLDPNDACRAVNPVWDGNWERHGKRQAEKNRGKSVRLSVAPVLIKTYGPIFFKGSAFALLSALLQQVVTKANEWGSRSSRFAS